MLRGMSTMAQVSLWRLIVRSRVWAQLVGACA